MKEVPKPDDAADALAIGVTHINSKIVSEVLQGGRT